MTDHIQVGDISPRIQYVGDGIQAAFAYPFPIFKTEDLEIHLGSQRQETGFTVSGAGIDAGGSVLFAVPPADGVVVTLRRRLAVQRTTDFQADGLIRAKTLNDELDYQTASIQQLADDLGRCVARPATSASAADLSLPEPAAGRTLKWSADGAALVNSSLDPDTLGSAAASAVAAEGVAVEARDGAIAAQAAAETARDQAVAAAASVADPLEGTQNLADLPDKAASRANLSVYSAAETDAAIAAAGLTQAMLDRLAFLETNLAVNMLRDQIDSSWSVLRMVDGVADEFEDQTGIADLGGATYDAGGDYIHNSTVTVDTTGLTDTGMAHGSINYTMFDFTNVIPNGVTVTKLGVYSVVAATVDMKIGLKNSNTSMTAVVSEALSHPGGGWADLTLSTPYVVPATGTYVVGTYTTTQVQYGRGGATDDMTALSSTNHTSGTNTGYSYQSGALHITRFTYTTGATDVLVVSAAAPNAPAIAPGEARLVLLHQPVDAVTLDTDLVAEVSRDGGTTWTAIALTDEGPFDASTDILAGIADLSGQPSGTSMKWRVRTLNNKEQRLHGVWMQWR